MSVALQTSELSPEAIALIKAGTPSPQSLRRPLDLSVTNTVAAETKVLGQDRETEQWSRQDSSANPMQPGTIALANETPATPRLGEKPSDEGKTISAAAGASFVSMTVRVPSGLPIRLLRAATDRKINQQSPFTQQEIVAQALEQWLRTHGY